VTRGTTQVRTTLLPKKCDLLAIIPVRNKDVPIYRTKGENRKRMKRHLPEEYKRRAKVESVHSAIKRKSGSFVRSRIPELTEKEIALKIIAYNIRRILIISNSIFIFIIFRFSTELNVTINLHTLKYLKLP